MKSSRLTVYVDSREPDKRKRGADRVWDTIVKELPVGDYLYNNTVIEYKTIPDFMSSITDNRLWKETVSQAMEFKHHYVVIEGDLDKELNRLRYSANVNYSKAMFNGALVSISTYTNVLQAGNQHQAFEIMDLIFRKTNDGKNRLQLPVEKPSNNPVFNYLAGIYKVGSDRANLIIDALELHNLNELMVITKDDLLSIDGIGESTANRVMEAII